MSKQKKVNRMQQPPKAKPQQQPAQPKQPQAVVEKQVPMGDQYEKWRGQIMSRDMLKTAAAELAQEIYGNAMGIQKEVFEECARMAGYDSVADMQAHGRELSLHWPSRTINILTAQLKDPDLKVH